MIEKLEQLELSMGNGIYQVSTPVSTITDKLNEVIDYLNDLQPKEVPDSAAHLKPGETCVVPDKFKPGWTKEFIEGPGEVPYTNVKIKTREEYEVLEEKLAKIKREVNPGYIGEQWVMCPDCCKAIYSSHDLERNHHKCDLDKKSSIKQEPKWELGDTYWYITGDFKGIDNSTVRTDRYTGVRFRTKEQAEAALKEIKQVLEKYQ